MEEILNNVKKAMVGSWNWVEYQNSIQNGQCHDISRQAVKILRIMGINAQHVMGFVRYPVPVFSNDVHQEETTELRHWWVEIDEKAYEFAKGSLSNGVVSRYTIDVGDLENVMKPDGFEYLKECYV